MAEIYSSLEGTSGQSSALPGSEGITQYSHHPSNVGENERYISIAGGVALILSGIARRGLGGLLLGGLGAMMLRRGMTGYCGMYRALKLSSQPSDRPGVPDHLGIKIERSISIDRPKEELFGLWRNFENLPQFLKHLVRVDVVDEKRSHWVAKTPKGGLFEWDAEIVRERPNEMISWESLPGTKYPNAGSIWFEPDPHGHGTVIRVKLEYQLPGGELEAWFARMLDESPEQDLEQDLKALKSKLEVPQMVH